GGPRGPRRRALPLRPGRGGLPAADARDGGHAGAHQAPGPDAPGGAEPRRRGMSESWENEDDGVEVEWTGGADPTVDVEPTEEELQLERALKAGLSEFELSDEDLELVETGQLPEGDLDEAETRPVVAVVGRPNVGKSS